MKFEFVNELNYILDASYYLEQRLNKNEEYHSIMNNLSEYGVPKEKITAIFANYQKLIDALDQEEIEIDSEIVPFLKAKNDRSIATHLFFHIFSHEGESPEAALNGFLSSYLSSFIHETKDEEITINKLEDLIEVLSLTDFDNETKMVYINFYYNYHNYYQKIKELLERTSKVIQKYDYLIKKEVIKNFEEARERIVEYPVFLKIENAGEAVIVQPSIFAFNAMSLMGEKLNRLYYGYLFFILTDLKSYSLSEETLIMNCFKALGDKTRFRIFSMLQNKKLYLQELSRLVGLTPATVSYHLDYLKRFNLIEIEEVSIDTNKIYYRLNTSVVHKLIDYLNKVMEGN